MNGKNLTTYFTKSGFVYKQITWKMNSARQYIVAENVFNSKNKNKKIYKMFNIQVCREYVNALLRTSRYIAD